MKYVNVVLWCCSWMIEKVSDAIFGFAPAPISRWANMVCMSQLTDRSMFLRPTQSWLGFALDEEESGYGSAMAPPCTCEFLVDFEDGYGPQHRYGCPLNPRTRREE